MRASLIFLILAVLVVLTWGRRSCKTNADCRCGGVCIQKGRKPCTPESQFCRCKRGCIVADKYFRRGQTKTVYCNRCSCSVDPNSGSMIPCTRRSWCDLPEGIPLYPDGAPCPNRP